MPKKEKNCWILLNPISGARNQRERITAYFERAFSARPDYRYSLIHTEYAGHAKELSVQAAKEGVDQVIAVGGDGTLNEVAGGLVNSNTALSLIPTGSGNGFARSLGIPLKAERAIDHCLHPKEVQIDVGRINGQYFFGVAGIGLDAEIGASFQNFGKRGPWPYFYIGIKVFRKFKYQSVQIKSTVQSIRINPLLITIANTQQYGNGAIIAPMADYQDGLLDVCMVERFPFLKGLLRLGRLFNGTIDRFEFYSHFQTEKLMIVRQREGYFHTDGEPHPGGKELEISVLKGALKVWS